MVYLSRLNCLTRLLLLAFTVHQLLLVTVTAAQASVAKQQSDELVTVQVPQNNPAKQQRSFKLFRHANTAQPRPIEVLAELGDWDPHAEGESHPVLSSHNDPDPEEELGEDSEDPMVEEEEKLVASNSKDTVVEVERNQNNNDSVTVKPALDNVPPQTTGHESELESPLTNDERTSLQVAKSLVGDAEEVIDAIVPPRSSPPSSEVVQNSNSHVKSNLSRKTSHNNLQRNQETTPTPTPPTFRKPETKESRKTIENKTTSPLQLNDELPNNTTNFVNTSTTTLNAKGNLSSKLDVDKKPTNTIAVPSQREVNTSSTTVKQPTETTNPDYIRPDNKTVEHSEIANRLVAYKNDEHTISYSTETDSQPTGTNARAVSTPKPVEVTGSDFLDIINDTATNSSHMEEQQPSSNNISSELPIGTGDTVSKESMNQSTGEPNQELVVDSGVTPRFKSLELSSTLPSGETYEMTTSTSASENELVKEITYRAPPKAMSSLEEVKDALSKSTQTDSEEALVFADSSQTSTEPQVLLEDNDSFLVLDSLPSFTETATYTVFCVLTVVLLQLFKLVKVILFEDSTSSNRTEITKIDTTQEIKKELRDKLEDMKAKFDLEQEARRLEMRHRYLLERTKLAPLETRLKKLREQIHCESYTSAGKNFISVYATYESSRKKNLQLKSKIELLQGEYLSHLRELVEMVDLIDIKDVQFITQVERLRDTITLLEVETQFLEEQLSIFRKHSISFKQQHEKMMEEINETKENLKRIDKEFSNLKNENEEATLDATIEGLGRNIDSKVAEADGYYREYINNYYFNNSFTVCQSDEVVGC